MGAPPLVFEKGWLIDHFYASLPFCSCVFRSSSCRMVNEMYTVHVILVFSTFDLWSITLITTSRSLAILTYSSRAPSRSPTTLPSASHRSSSPHKNQEPHLHQVEYRSTRIDQHHASVLYRPTSAVWRTCDHPLYAGLRSLHPHVGPALLR